MSFFGPSGLSRLFDRKLGALGPPNFASAPATAESLEATCECIRHSEERYRLIFETSVDCIAINRVVDGIYIDCNQAFVDATGFTREEILGRTSLELGIWCDPADRKKLIDELHRNKSSRDIEASFRRKNGNIFWGRMSAARLDIDGVSCILSITRDISEAKAASDRLAASIRALQLSEVRYRTVFESCFDGIIISNLSDGVIVDINPAFLEVMGYSRDEVIGRNSVQIGLWANLQDRDRMYEILRTQRACHGLEALFCKKNGDTVRAVLSASLMEIDGNPSLIVIARDVSAAKAAEDEIRNLAFYDQLTQLANRRLLVDRLRQALASCGRTNCTGALLFIDLDDFKTLNDTLGHNTGDLLLREMAQRISTCIRESDVVSRFGGDEFVVILEDLSSGSEDAAAVAENVAEKLLRTVAEPCQLAGRECRITSSIGIALFGDSRNSLDDIMQQADLAMYQAKAAGGNAARFFAPALQAAVNARAAMEVDLRRAIGTSQFQLYYQPQVHRDRIAGAEALLRWKHPRRGFLSPDEFIPIAEKTGLIVPLGAWVVETAFAQMARWANQEGMGGLTIAVNISARQFRQPDFVGQVLSALQRTGANPAQIRLELTETMLVDNIEDVKAKMTSLKGHGLKLSIDDFGTGYSSLSYLSHLPLDQLKIDRSFVSSMLDDTGSGAIAKAIIALSHSMGLSVVAEGVETEQQREFLSSSGCHNFQGYLFSPAVTAPEFERQVLTGQAERQVPDELPAPIPVASTNSHAAASLSRQA